MADEKISALPATSTLSASDLVPVVQGGTTKALSPTTVGANLVTATNPSAITFPKVAADNSVSFRTPAQVLGDIGAQASGSYAASGANTDITSLQSGVGLTSPKVTTGIDDANGKSMLAFTATASAVDGFTLTNAASASPATVKMEATGSDSTININISPKGSSSRINSGIIYAAQPIYTFSNQSTAQSATYTNSRMSLDENLGGVYLSSGLGINWATIDDLHLFTKDTGLYRTAAAVVEINDGTAGHKGTVLLRGQTIASLPASPVAGMRATVTDGDSGLAWGATAVNTGSGATTYAVWYNGSAWTVEGK